MKKILTPMQRRDAVAWTMQDRQLSQRHACRVLGQTRGTQRRTLQVRAQDGAAESRLMELANAHGAWGCPQPK